MQGHAGSRWLSAGLLFLDEIQATPHAIAALRYFYEERPEFAVIVAGSLLEFSVSSHSFSMPVGRVEYFRMGPVTFTEYLNAIDPDLTEYVAEYQTGTFFPESAHRKLLDHQRRFLSLGGLPEAGQAAIDGASFQEVQLLQRSLVDTFRDDFAKYAAHSQLVRLPFVPTLICLYAQGCARRFTTPQHQAFRLPPNLIRTCTNCSILT